MNKDFCCYRTDEKGSHKCMNRDVNEVRCSYNNNEEAKEDCIGYQNQYGHLIKENVSSSVDTKFDQHKLRVDLFPFTTLLAISDILTHGAEKYGERNWEKGIEYSRILGALLRHLLRWFYRIEKDIDSGRDHIHHAGCEMAFLQHFEMTGTGIDDRPMLSEEAQERLEELFDRWEKGEEK